MVLGDADMHAMVDSRNSVDQRPRPVPYGNAVSAILQLSSRLRQVSGWPLPLLSATHLHVLTD